MATAADLLALPSGWNWVYRHAGADPGPLGPDAEVEVELLDFRTASAGPLWLGPRLPDVEQQLAAAAASRGSALYAFGVMHHSELDLGGLVRVDRYRVVGVHHQFPFLPLLLIALGFIVGMIVVDSQSAQAILKDLEGQLCKLFGVSCAIEAVQSVVVTYALVAGGVAVAAALLLKQFGAEKAAESFKPQAMPKVGTNVKLGPYGAGVDTG